MDHNRAVELIVCTLISEVETLGEVVVNLDGTELPAAAESVLDHKVELRTIERSLTILDYGVQTLLLGCLNDCALCLLPILIRADVLLGVVGVTQRDLRSVLVELQSLEDVEYDVDNLLELLQKLVGTNEEVSIVLGKSAYTSQSVQLTRLLVAVYCTELRQTNGEILVRTGLATVDLAVVRTVHRLEQILLTLDGSVDRLERILTVLCVVTRCYVEILITDMRSDYLLVTVILLNLAEEALQTVAQLCTLGQPQRKTLAYALREGEELEILTEFAVVTLLGLLQHCQVLIEHRLLGERNTVDTGQHLILLVTAPVSTCD